jgi:hypothetical protein
MPISIIYQATRNFDSALSPTLTETIVTFSSLKVIVSDTDLNLGRLRLATSFGAQRAAAWMTG